MPKYTKAQRERKKKIFASMIAKGYTQTSAYQEAYPEAKKKHAHSYASTYAAKPDVKQCIQEAIEEIDYKDAQEVVRNVVKDAKGMKKVVFVDGKRKNIADNQGTIASREQFFKLTQHPAFTKQTNLNIDNRQQTVNLDAQSIEALTSAVERLERLYKDSSSGDIDTDLGKVDIVDV